MAVRKIFVVTALNPRCPDTERTLVHLARFKRTRAPELPIEVVQHGSGLADVLITASATPHNKRKFPLVVPEEDDGYHYVWEPDQEWLDGRFPLVD